MCYHFLYVAVNRTWLLSRRGIAALGISLGYLFLGAALSTQADSAATYAAKQLADRVAAQLDAKPAYRVEFRDLTGQMPPAEFSQARSAFLDEFSARGIQLAPSSQPVSIWIKLSRDVNSRLWIAEFPQNASLSPELVDFPLETETGLAPQTAFALRKQLIFQQRLPILDFGIASELANPGAPLLVLTREQIGKFRFQNGAWQAAGSFLPIEFRALPRDVIADIGFNGANFRARVGSVNCAGSVADVSTTMCSTESPSVWGLGSTGFRTQDSTYFTGRNWFRWDGWAGPVSLHSSVGILAGGQSVWIDAETSGVTGVYDEKKRQLVANVGGWGSFLVRIPDSCGADGLIAATRNGDYTQADGVQIYQWTGTGFRSVGAEVQFEGPVIALGAVDAQSIRAVVHNLKTGFYEAYLLNASCNR